MNIFMNDAQRYNELKALVQSSYTTESEAEDVWKSIRWNLLTPDQTKIIDERLDKYSQFLETGKPICHLDFFVGNNDEDPFLNALDKPYVSTPCCEFTMGRISESRRHFRFIYVNPDVNGAEDFSFMNKLALKDTYILVTRGYGESSDIRKIGSVPLHAKECENIRFIVHCFVDSDNRHFRYNQMLDVWDFKTFEKDGETFVNFSATPFENKETNLQKRLGSRMNRKLLLNKELLAQLPRLGVWKWSDIIRMYLF